MTAIGSKTKIEGIVLDLSDFESVKQAAEKVKALGVTLDYLINNAGIMAVPYKKVAGYESQFIS